MGSNFGDNELSALAPLSQRIVIADFSSTAITDRSASAIAVMKQLRVLRLMHTNITDTSVLALASLDQLESLSVFDTRITPASLTTLAHLPKLRRIYAGGTKISADASISRELRDKLVF
jgi:Leucine-rich repeat (LRR) protein